jgi:hypothetical protein
VFYTPEHVFAHTPDECTQQRHALSKVLFGFGSCDGKISDPGEITPRGPHPPLIRTASQNNPRVTYGAFAWLYRPSETR